MHNGHTITITRNFFQKQHSSQSPVKTHSLSMTRLCFSKLGNKLDKTSLISNLRNERAHPATSCYMIKTESVLKNKNETIPRSIIPKKERKIHHVMRQNTFHNQNDNKNLKLWLDFKRTFVKFLNSSKAPKHSAQLLK